MYADPALRVNALRLYRANFDRSLHDPELSSLAQSYKFKVYPETPSVVAEFPLKGKFSIFLGIFKIYPKIANHMKSRGYPQTMSFEMYELNKKIIYAFPIQK